MEKAKVNFVLLPGKKNQEKHSNAKLILYKILNQCHLKIVSMNDPHIFLNHAKTKEIVIHVDNEI